MFELGDCINIMSKMKRNSVDLILGSPPYESRRTYGELGFSLKGEDWVEWMVRVCQQAVRVCRGLIAFVMQGMTNKFEWSATPALLMADLKRAGCHVRNPIIYHRSGIPGSGGKDWLRSDYEWVLCLQGSKGKLPWSDNTICGQPPKWDIGGLMSHRHVDGQRKNHHHRGSHDKARKNREVNGSQRWQDYKPPSLANPGNVFRTKVGGNLMGHALAHENEAPYSLDFCRFMILSFCRPGGTVLDPFMGSGTTLEAAFENSRKAIGIDIRQSQVDLAQRRCETVTPLFWETADAEDDRECGDNQRELPGVQRVLDASDEESPQVVPFLPPIQVSEQEDASLSPDEPPRIA